MSALAQYLFSKGIKISGSDSTESIYTQKLAEKGVAIGIPDGQKYARGCDLVVINSAIRPDNKELQNLIMQNKTVASREEVLGAIFNEFAKSVAVCGMHGKTTCSAMISKCLDFCNKSPTVFVGGTVKDFDSNFLLGDSEICVAEACEYKANFLSLHPFINCMLNVDSDHLDFYKNIDDITDAFRHFAKNTKSGGINVVNGDDKILKNFDGIKFGLSEDNDYVAKNVIHKNAKYSFDLFKRGSYVATVNLNVLGAHNVYNALCAFCVADLLGIPSDEIKAGIESFCGVDRRCTIIKGRFTVITDYAHHPREIKTFLDTVSQMGFDTVRLVFQPHTYTRTRGLFDDFVKSLKADEVYLIPTFAAREDVIAGFESKDLAKAMEDDGTNVKYFEDSAQLARLLNETSKSNDAVLLVGAGDIDQMSKLLK